MTSLLCGKTRPIFLHHQSLTRCTVKVGLWRGRAVRASHKHDTFFPLQDVVRAWKRTSGAQRRERKSPFAKPSENRTAAVTASHRAKPSGAKSVKSKSLNELFRAMVLQPQGVRKKERAATTQCTHTKEYQWEQHAMEQLVPQTGTLHYIFRDYDDVVEQLAPKPAQK